MNCRYYHYWSIFAVFTALLVTAIQVNTAQADTVDIVNKQNPGRDQRRNDVLVIAKVSDNPKKHFRYLKPMADYLVSKMTDLGINKSEVLLAKNNQQMIQYLKAGRVDLITESVVSTALFAKQAKTTPLVRKWKNASPSYQSLIFVRSDSDVHSTTGLIGKRIALADPGSTSAYFIPMATLLQTGLPVVTLSTPHDTVPADAVGVFLTSSDKTISPLVYGGVVEAGALSSIDWKKKKRVPKKHKQAYRIIHSSHAWPRMLESVAAHVNKTVKNRIKNILINAHLDPAAKSALYAYQKTSKFEALNQEDFNALAEAEQMLSVVNTVSPP